MDTVNIYMVCGKEKLYGFEQSIQTPIPAIGDNILIGHKDTFLVLNRGFAYAVTGGNLLAITLHVREQHSNLP